MGPEAATDITTAVRIGEYESPDPLPWVTSAQSARVVNLVSCFVLVRRATARGLVRRICLFQLDGQVFDKILETPQLCHGLVQVRVGTSRVVWHIAGDVLKAASPPRRSVGGRKKTGNICPAAIGARRLLVTTDFTSSTNYAAPQLRHRDGR